MAVNGDNVLAITGSVQYFDAVAGDDTDFPVIAGETAKMLRSPI